jgi:hypothetical protein
MFRDPSGTTAFKQTMTMINQTLANPDAFAFNQPASGFAADFRGSDRLAGAGPADLREERESSGGVASRIPYPAMDQVEHSVAIQRLLWVRHLPPPRTAAERRIFERIRDLGWNAPS